MTDHAKLIARLRTLLPYFATTPATTLQGQPIADDYRLIFDRTHAALSEAIAALTAGRAAEPTDDEVNAGIDALAEQAARRIAGTSGHAWGARAEIKRQADALKAALADRTAAEAAPPEGLAKHWRCVLDPDGIARCVTHDEKCVWSDDGWRCPETWQVLIDVADPPQVSTRLRAAQDSEPTP